MAGPAARAPHPTARGLLSWMQARPGRLPELLAREAAGSDDLAPAGDPAVRAHLALVAEALAANAAPAAAPALERLARELPARLARREADVDAQMGRVGEAHAFEVGLQFGEVAAGDPGIEPMLERRVRIAAWTRVFLGLLDEAREGRPPIADDVLAWMNERQTQLADTIFAMDRRAKQIEIDRGGPDAVAGPETVNRIGQAATLQAHTRFLVEALAEHL
ncbi:hypothetical protein [Miltoncostaea marina]|uniref:hypothetical protein n=1 Tax=Miltoncostaea marina TaxID=2843215 RepID=UPI001C3CEC23|nr:hypothetical protein [Miltoncostaea marina]